MIPIVLPRPITLKPGNTNNFNMRTAVGNVRGPVWLRCVVEGTVGSTSTATPALTTGTGWAPGSLLHLINKGIVRGSVGATGSNGSGSSGNFGTSGAGGSGGSGGTPSGQSGSSGGTGGAGSATDGGSGTPGGPALDATSKIIVKNEGTISGGDGGPAGLGGIGSGGSGGGGGGGGGGGRSFRDSISNAYISTQNGGDGGWGAGRNGSRTFGTTGPSGSKGGDGGIYQGSGTAGQQPGGVVPPSGQSATNWSGGAGGPNGSRGTTRYGSDGSAGTRGYAVNGTANIKFVQTGTIVGSTV